MWARNDIESGRQYKLLLCQRDDGTRYYLLLEADSTTDPLDAVLCTSVVPNELLTRRDFIGIAEAVRLTDGSRFVVDAHGVWYTELEATELSSGIAFDDVDWVTGTPPRLPPK